MLEVSVIIPVKNSKIVMDTIRSIKKQTYPQEKIEIVIAGQDDSGQLQKLKKKNVKFIEVESELALPGYNRNIAIDKAKGEYLFFTDSDCVPCKDWVEKLMLQHKKGKDVVGGSIAVKNANFWSLCDNISHFHEHLNITKSGLRNNLPTANLSLKKKIVLGVGKFDGRLVTGEDIDLIMKIRKLGHKLHFDNISYVVHNHPRNSLKKIILHSFAWGKSGITMRRKYKDLTNIPKIMQNRTLLLLLSPLIALYASLRVYKNPKMLKYLHTFPIIFLSKMAWCYGAFNVKNDT